jgi:large subunit ribosomal protein L35
MPKVKTNRAAAKRFKRTKNGGLKRNKAFARHLLTHKDAKRRRNLRTASMLEKVDAARINKLLPYS